ncbi:MAG TPA: hypothetical protein D7I06_03040 [Candidatus Poseidoniales archaeon]|nr:MAG TPA: hypothetical protein D7I06_03040 [Candidatus Poseidoniales archaeon]HII62564.1 hypothetical protein [Candidatus Poseidoniaceae archaeon]
MPEWLTSGGLFSVQSGWSMISTRIRPEPFDEKEAMTRIRRLLLDLARGPSEISKGLLDEQRFGSDSVDSNRLDPYQVGASILSAYTNNPLNIFNHSNVSSKNISLGDCIQACIFKTNLFSKIDKDQKERDFINLVLKFLVYIRDNNHAKEDHKFLANKILSFCSIARIMPTDPKDVHQQSNHEKNELHQILNNYTGRNGRLLQISLTKIHTVADYLKLPPKLKWGWSVAITVCFEKAIDNAYSDPKHGFTDSLWLMSRTPGRALFFYNSENIDLLEKEKFVSIFEECIIDYLVDFCQGAIDLGDDSDETNWYSILDELYAAQRKGEFNEIVRNIVRINNSGGRRPLYKLFDEDKTQNPTQQNVDWVEEKSETPRWAMSLKLPASRGNRRFRMIQSLWQDIHSIGGNALQTMIRAQRKSENKSFVYLDCIQLGDLLWQDNNWIRCFTKAKMLAPVIEVLLSLFISAFDTLYPNHEGEDLDFGPMALGGDELHILVPETKEGVEDIIARIEEILIPQFKKYKLVKLTEWKKQGSNRLVLKNKKSNKTPLPSCPERMWWFGIIELDSDKEIMNSQIDGFLEQIKEIKDSNRVNWNAANHDQTMFYTLNH